MRLKSFTQTSTYTKSNLIISIGQPRQFISIHVKKYSRYSANNLNLFPAKKKKLTEKEKVEKSIAKNKEISFYDDLLPRSFYLHHLLDKEKDLQYKIEVLEIRQDNEDKSASERAKAKKELAVAKQDLAKVKAEFVEKRDVYRILYKAYEEWEESKKKAK